MMEGIISTIGQKCRRCYSCVRECPATAIRVENGQAVVISDRCISCGHCVKVCSQHAKKVYSDIEKVLFEFIPTYQTIAIVAPSFAAAFPFDYLKIPTALRKIGFDKVIETAFGADLVAKIYQDNFETTNGKTVISSPCPAIFNYIEKYFVDLVPNLAGIVSPMIALGRYLKSTISNDIKVVFIGPCIAKKSEYQAEEVAGDIDSVLTFTELKEIMAELKINLEDCKESDFDPPYGNMGKSFALPGGLLKTADISSDILAKKVIVVEGKDQVKEVIQDIADKKIQSKFIDILFCEGCISGPGIDSELNYYSRREKVINYIEEKINNVDRQVWKSNIYNSRNLNLSREFKSNLQRKPMPSEEKITEILARSNKLEKKDELNCGACGYKSCREYAIAIAKGLAEDDMCLPYLIEKLEKANIDLKETQDQLHSAEKLASIGQLAAGVAHEINNPLGTIMLYTSMLKKDVKKIECIERTTEDLDLILNEANRCKNIVSNLLNFARQGKLKISQIDISSVINEIIKSVSLKPEFEKIKFNFNDNTESMKIEADADQIKQVLLNLIINACEAVEESDIKIVTINLRNDDTNIIMDVYDTGCGITEENIKKLYTPFFTTKKIGKGTGLGLAITYGIIKMHRGDIKVESKINEGTKFSIKLPIKHSLKQIMVN